MLKDLPAEIQLKPDNYFYKKHADHPGFNPPPELKAVLDSQKKREAMAAAGGSSIPAAPQGPPPEIREPQGVE